jgi:hypothetical protein
MKRDIEKDKKLSIKFLPRNDTITCILFDDKYSHDYFKIQGRLGNVIASKLLATEIILNGRKVQILMDT